MSDKETIAVYDAQADKYSQMTKDLDGLEQLEAFAKALPENARILDLGCGPGFYAGWLAKAGFQVDATDASSEMVALASQQQGVTAWQAEFGDVPNVPTYHGVWASFSLLHAKRAEFPGFLAQLKQASHPKAILHLGMKLGSGEGPDSLGRHYAYYGEDELVDLLAKAGFTVFSRTFGDSPGLSGNIEPWILVQAHG